MALAAMNSSTGRCRYDWKTGYQVRKEKVVLTVCDAPEGLQSRLIQSIPHQGRIITSAITMAELGSYEKERKGPAEEVLQGYTAYMKELLGVKQAEVKQVSGGDDDTIELIEIKPRCPVCNSNRYYSYTVVMQGKEYTKWRCQDCNFLYNEK